MVADGLPVGNTLNLTILANPGRSCEILRSGQERRAAKSSYRKDAKSAKEDKGRSRK